MTESQVKKNSLLGLSLTPQQKSDLGNIIGATEDLIHDSTFLEILSKNSIKMETDSKGGLKLLDMAGKKPWNWSSLLSLIVEYVKKNPITRKQMAGTSGNSAGGGNSIPVTPDLLFLAKDYSSLIYDLDYFETRINNAWGPFDQYPLLVQTNITTLLSNMDTLKTNLGKATEDFKLKKELYKICTRKWEGGRQISLYPLVDNDRDSQREVSRDRSLYSGFTTK